MTSIAPTPTSSSDEPLRVALVDDSALFRQGLAALLTAAGLRVVAELSDPRPLDAVIAAHDPHLVILDIRMPPTHTDEGITTALHVRRNHPGVGALVLSTYAEGTWARALLREGSAGLGYLLKDRVDNVAALVEAIRRVAGGGTAVDPELIGHLLQPAAPGSVLDGLSEREREVLSLMTQGLSNAGIAQTLFLSPRTVEAHIANIFGKLPLEDADNTMNRRVLAVLTFLQSGATS